MLKIIWLIFLFISFNCFSIDYPKNPNPKTNPGMKCSTSNPDFSEYRYREKIPYCTRNVSSSLKKSLYELYNVPSDERKDYTIDHIIPLSLGGSNDFGNLWPEHKNVKATRMNLEICLFTNLRDSLLTQREAVDLILRVKFSLPHDQYLPCLNQ